MFVDTPDDDSAEDVVVEEAVARERDINLALFLSTRLTPRQQEVLYARFVEEKTLQEVAEKMGLSRTRVYQVKEVALRKMKQVQYERVLFENFPASTPARPRNWQVEQLDPTSEQIQVVLGCLPEKATIEGLLVSHTLANKLISKGYYFRLKDLLAKTPIEIEEEWEQGSGEITSALVYRAKELFGELLAGNAPWVGEKIEEARNTLVALESDKLQKKLAGLNARQAVDKKPVENVPHAETEVGGVWARVRNWFKRGGSA